MAPFGSIILLEFHHAGFRSDSDIGRTHTQGQGRAILQGVDKGLIQTRSAPLDRYQLTVAGKIALASLMVLFIKAKKLALLQI